MDLLLPQAVRRSFHPKQEEERDVNKPKAWNIPDCWFLPTSLSLVSLGKRK